MGDGNDACVEALRASGALLLEEAYGHKYPYDWRTKKPTIFRATAQWFASVEGFRDEALEALDDVTFIPASGAKRMRPMVSGRNDWCISRQRAWGVPIPCFYDKTDDDEPLMNAETIAHVTAIVAEKGTDAWWELPIEDLLPDAYKSRAADLVRGTDTMDVWFDSGSSWAGVVKARGLKYPADMYLEGSDQHRGWFQSSLLTGVAAEGKAPYETVLTHGFVLDEKGFKMSKSLGNVVDPKTIIEGGKNQKTDPAYGADTLRMWVASTDYTGDVLLGQNVLKQTSEQYRKLQGHGQVPDGQRRRLRPGRGRRAARRTAAFRPVRPAQSRRDGGGVGESAYEAYQYSRVTATIVSLTAFLSNVFLDVSKDRLYVDEATGEAREGGADHRQRHRRDVIGRFGARRAAHGGGGAQGVAAFGRAPAIHLPAGVAHAPRRVDERRERRGVRVLDQGAGDSRRRQPRRRGGAAREGGWREPGGEAPRALRGREFG